MRPRVNSGPRYNGFVAEDSTNSKHGNPPSYSEKRFSTPKEHRHQNGHSHPPANDHNMTNGSRPRTSFNGAGRTNHAFTDAKLSREKRPKSNFHRPGPNGLENEEIRKVPLTGGHTVSYGYPPGHNGQHAFSIPVFHPPPALHENGNTYIVSIIIGFASFMWICVMFVVLFC